MKSPLQAHDSLWAKFDRASADYSLKYQNRVVTSKRSHDVLEEVHFEEETLPFSSDASTNSIAFDRTDIVEYLPLPPQTVKMGQAEVNAIGLGSLPLGVGYSGGGRPPREEAIKLIHTAIDMGVNFFDTADTYCSGPGDEHYCELLLGEALASHRDGDKVIVATKAGMKRTGSTSKGWAPAAYSSQQLRVRILRSRDALQNTGGRIGLWQFHHTDGYDLGKATHFRSHLRVVKELMDEGVIDNFGLCNASTEHATIALEEVRAVASIQNHFSLWDRSAEQVNHGPVKKASKHGLLPFCSQHDLAFLPYGVLGGHKHREGLLKMNRIPEIAKIARKKKVSCEAMFLSWVRHKWPCVVHIVGCRSLRHLRDIVASKDIRLTRSEFNRIDSTVLAKK